VYELNNKCLFHGNLRQSKGDRPSWRIRRQSNESRNGRDSDM